MSQQEAVLEDKDKKKKRGRPKKPTQQPKTTLEDIIQHARAQFQDINRYVYRRKREIIIQAAKKLEKIGIEKDKISTLLAESLKAFVNADYVREVLPQEYKNPHQSARAASGAAKHRSEKDTAATTEKQPKSTPMSHYTGMENSADDEDNEEREINQQPFDELIALDEVELERTANSMDHSSLVRHFMEAVRRLKQGV